VPIQLFTILAHHDITHLRSLITIAQNGGIYEEHIHFELNKNPENRINLTYILVNKPK